MCVCVCVCVCVCNSAIIIIIIILILYVYIYVCVQVWEKGQKRLSAMPHCLRRLAAVRHRLNLIIDDKKYVIIGYVLCTCMCDVSVCVML